MTPEQAKNLFRQQGKTITSQAQENGYNRNQVYQVLNGQCKARYGRVFDKEDVSLCAETLVEAATRSNGKILLARRFCELYQTRLSKIL